MLTTCNMYDVPYVGNYMTWSGKMNKMMVKFWLDKVMANDQWKATYSASKVNYL